MLNRSDDDVSLVYVVNSTLTHIPQQIFDRFTRLTSIEFINVGLRDLHQSWRNCSSLAIIRIENNNIRSIPANVFEFCNVQTSISLVRNQIEEIAQNAFHELSRLQYLSLEDNNIKTIHPNTFVPLGSLQVLNLDSTGIEDLHIATFWPLRSLLMLSLSFNRFSIIRSGTFYNLPLLQTIRMEGNPNVTRIESFGFGLMNFLHTIHMRNGTLGRLETESFEKLPRLQRLDIRSQQLTAIERTFLEKFPLIEVFDVRENICIDEKFSILSNENVSRIEVALENCFLRFEGQPVTTLGGSSIRISLTLLISLYLAIKFIS